jgi:hypothetical protein
MTAANPPQRHVNRRSRKAQYPDLPRPEVRAASVPALLPSPGASTHVGARPSVRHRRIRLWVSRAVQRGRDDLPPSWPSRPHWLPNPRCRCLCVGMRSSPMSAGKRYLASTTTAGRADAPTRWSVSPGATTLHRRNPSRPLMNTLTRQIRPSSLCSKTNAFRVIGRDAVDPTLEIERAPGLPEEPFRCPQFDNATALGITIDTGQPLDPSNRSTPIAELPLS